MLVCAGVVFPHSVARLRPAAGACLARAPFSAFFGSVSILNLKRKELGCDFSKMDGALIMGL